MLSRSLVGLSTLSGLKSDILGRTFVFDNDLICKSRNFSEAIQLISFYPLRFPKLHVCIRECIDTYADESPREDQESLLSVSRLFFN